MRGYKYIQARKKGILTEMDMKNRLNFARRIKREYNVSLWTEDVNFYLDGASFIARLLWHSIFQFRSAPRGTK